MGVIVFYGEPVKSTLFDTMSPEELDIISPRLNMLFRRCLKEYTLELRSPSTALFVVNALIYNHTMT